MRETRTFPSETRNGTDCRSLCLARLFLHRGVNACGTGHFAAFHGRTREVPVFPAVVQSLLAIHSLWRRPPVFASSPSVLPHNRFRSSGHSPSNRLAGICVYSGSSRMRRSASPGSLARVAGHRVRPWKSCLARRPQRGTGKRLCVYWINRKNCPRIRPTDSLRVRIVLKRRCNDAGQGSGA